MMRFTLLVFCILQASALRVLTTPDDMSFIGKPKKTPKGARAGLPQEGELPILQNLWGKYVNKSGGEATVLFIGDSINHQLLDFGEKHLRSVPGLKFQWVTAKYCLHDSKYPLKTPPTAIVWNFGLHLLHLFPAQSCDRKSKGGHKEPKSLTVQEEAQDAWLDGPNLPPSNCGHYKDVVSQSAKYFAENAPTSKLVYRATNWVCTDAFTGAFNESITKWHDANSRAQMEKDCRAKCPSWYGEGSDPRRNCGDELYDAHSTELQRQHALEALKEFPAVGFLDAFSVTKGRCDATDQDDGRHFRPVDGKLMIQLAKILLEEDHKEA